MAEAHAKLDNKTRPPTEAASFVRGRRGTEAPAPLPEHGSTNALVLLSQKAAGTDIENQLFEKIQV